MFLVILQEINKQWINIRRFNPQVKLDIHVMKNKKQQHIILE